VAKKTRQKKSFLDPLKSMLGSGRSADSDPQRKGAGSGRNGKGAAGGRRDLLAPFQLPTLDLDPLVHPTRDHPPDIPPTLNPGMVLVSQRHGVKCIHLITIGDIKVDKLRDICLRKLNPNQALYLPMGTQVLKDEILHQGRRLILNVRKGTVFVSPGGHPNGYLLNTLHLPLNKELSSNWEYLSLTEQLAKRNLQSLADIPLSFSLLKEDLLYDNSVPEQEIEKGTLVISRGGVLIGFMLEDVQLPLETSVADLDALFPLKITYQSLPIEALIQRAAKLGSKELPIERGTFLFSPQGKIYFVWKEGIKASFQELNGWARSQIVNPGILYVSATKANVIGGPGDVITQEEIGYLRDVFRDVGTTNIYRESLLLDNNIFFKFMKDMPYAQTGRFRAYLQTKQVVLLNTFHKGATFSVELGGDAIEITDLDLEQVRKHLQPTGRIMIKLGSLLRVRDERYGDWIYRVTINLFYPYDTLTRPYMEEFIPENITFQGRGEKISILIGPQDRPKEGDIGGAGEPIGDLLAIINNELDNDRIVFLLDNTLFHWQGRLYRVNEEQVFRPQHVDKLEKQDLEVLEADWKIHPIVEDYSDSEEEVPVIEEEEEDLEDLPFDTSAHR